MPSAVASYPVLPMVALFPEGIPTVGFPFLMSTVIRLFVPIEIVEPPILTDTVPSTAPAPSARVSLPLESISALTDSSPTITIAVPLLNFAPLGAIIV